MAVNQLKEYMDKGNIINSVNYPNCKLKEKEKKYRILINAVSDNLIINDIIDTKEKADINIYEKGIYKYIVIDCDEKINIKNSECVKKVRTI